MRNLYHIIIGNVLFAAIFCDAAFSQHQFLNNYQLDKTGSLSSSNLPSNSISQIATTDSILWIGTSDGLAKSSDGGRSWISYQGNPKFVNDGIYALAVDGRRIWTSTGFTQKIKEGSVPTGTGYTYSTDNGETWQLVGQTLDHKDSSIISYGINDSIWILPIVVPEQNVTYDISLSTDLHSDSVTGGTVWIASWASGLRKSTDNGAQWQRILLPLDQMNTLKPTDTLWTYAASDTAKRHKIFPRFDPRGDATNHSNNLKAFSVCAIDNDTIWCGTAGGVNKSTDGGWSWTKFTHQNQEEPILGNWVITIKEQRFQSKQRIWITNWKSEDPNEDYGVSYTEDGGRTWKNFLHGIKAYNFAFKDSIVYIGTDDGLYRTQDGGQSFMISKQFINLTTRQRIMSKSIYSIGVIGDTIYVGTDEGIASTIDDSLHLFGSNWYIYQTYSISAYPNPFSVSNDGEVKIRYGEFIADPQNSIQRNVTIEIFDFGMNRVRTLIRNATRTAAEDSEERWDGLGDNGKVVAGGVYFYRVKVDNNEPTFGKILVLP
jgi:hypothetical protein